MKELNYELLEQFERNEVKLTFTDLNDYPTSNIIDEFDFIVDLVDKELQFIDLTDDNILAYIKLDDIIDIVENDDNVEIITLTGIYSLV